MARISKKTVSFDDTVHFIDEENIVTYKDFDCGITFYHETPTKTERSTENGITFPELLKNQNAFAVTIGINFLLMSSITLMSL